MKTRSEVFNNSIGFPYSFTYPKLTDQQSREILAGLFEQLLVFDKVIISTNRLNFAVFFLIQKLGINVVERLIDKGYISFMIWTPVIVTGSGTQREDGTVDDSTIYGQPPLVSGMLSDDDKDPEKNLDMGLSLFSLHEDRKRIFKRSALKSYIVPNGMEFSNGSAELIINAYKNDNLRELGLPFDREPEQLHTKERMQLLELGHKALEIAILSEYGLKSYENFEHYSIFKENLKNIGKAYNVAGNSDVLFNLENLPYLKQLFLQEQMSFEDVFKIRYMGNARFYRQWINEVGEKADAKQITAEYLNEIKGNTKFFASTAGKFLKNLAMYGVSTGLGAMVAGAPGITAGYALGLLDNFVLDRLLIGKNPSMFIDDIKSKIKRG